MTTIYDIKKALLPGIVLVEGIEARSRAQELFQLWTPHTERTVALLEPGPDNRLGSTISDLARKGVAIVVAHPSWSQVTMWEWADRARTVLHASHGELKVVR